jgi:hypothetical protein
MRADRLESKSFDPGRNEKSAFSKIRDSLDNNPVRESHSNIRVTRADGAQT